MQYKIGTVSVVNGSQFVTGTGTNFLAAGIQAGYGFAIIGDGVSYQINSTPTDATHLTLSVPYAGVTNSSAAYYIFTAYTPNFNLRDINMYDAEWWNTLNYNLAKIDAGMSIIGEASSQAQENALFAAGYTMVVRLDLLPGFTTTTTLTPTSTTSTVGPTTTSTTHSPTTTTSGPTTTTTSTSTTSGPTTTTTSGPTTTTTSTTTTAAPTTTTSATTTGGATTTTTTLSGALLYDSFAGSNGSAINSSNWNINTSGLLETGSSWTILNNAEYLYLASSNGFSAYKQIESVNTYPIGSGHYIQVDVTDSLLYDSTAASTITIGYIGNWTGQNLLQVCLNPYNSSENTIVWNSWNSSGTPSSGNIIQQTAGNKHTYKILLTGASTASLYIDGTLAGSFTHTAVLSGTGNVGFDLQTGSLPSNVFRSASFANFYYF